jgi:hypothetical protein
MRVAAAFGATYRSNESLLLDDDGSPFHSPAHSQISPLGMQSAKSRGIRDEVARRQKSCAKLSVTARKRTSWTDRRPEATWKSIIEVHWIGTNGPKINLARPEVWLAGLDLVGRVCPGIAGGRPKKRSSNRDVRRGQTAAKRAIARGHFKKTLRLRSRGLSAKAAGGHNNFTHSRRIACTSKAATGFLSSGPSIVKG